jgi:hypothetical protein
MTRFADSVLRCGQGCQVRCNGWNRRNQLRNNGLFLFVSLRLPNVRACGLGRIRHFENGLFWVNMSIWLRIIQFASLAAEAAVETEHKRLQA